MSEPGTGGQRSSKVLLVLSTVPLHNNGVRFKSNFPDAARASGERP